MSNESKDNASVNVTAKSQEFVVRFADDIYQSYEDLMAAADQFHATGEVTFLRTRDDDFNNRRDYPEFWKHYSLIKGVSPPKADKYPFFHWVDMWPFSS